MEFDVPFSIDPKSTVALPVKLTTYQPGPYSQELTFYLNVNNSLVIKKLPIGGSAVDVLGKLKSNSADQQSELVETPE